MSDAVASEDSVLSQLLINLGRRAEALECPWIENDIQEVTDWWNNFRLKDFVSCQVFEEPQDLMYTLVDIDETNIEVQTIQCQTSTSKVNDSWREELDNYIVGHAFDLSVNKGLVTVVEIYESLYYNMNKTAIISSNSKWLDGFKNYNNVIPVDSDNIDDDEIIICTTKAARRVPLMWGLYWICPSAGIIRDTWQIIPDNGKFFELYRILE